MRRIILIVMFFMGIFPRLQHGKIKIFQLSQAHAATFSDEDGDDPGDPDDPENPDPCDGGSSYPTTTSTISGNITTLTTCSYNYDGCGNYIGYSCDGGVQCGISSAGISLSETSGNINDEVTLTASTSFVGSPVIQYEFQQSSDGGISWTDVGNDPSSSSFIYTIDESGQSQFRVIESCDCSVSVTSTLATFTAAAPQCGVTKCKLTLSSTTGNLNDVVTLTAKATVTGTPSTINYDFQVWDDDHWNDLGTSTSSIYSYLIDEGDTQFQVIANASCSGANTSATSLTKEFDASSSNISLSSDQTAGKPLDYVTLTATVSNAYSLINLSYVFQVFYNNTWFNFAPQPSNTLSYQASVLGSMQFRVMITYDGSPSAPVVSPTVNYDVSFCADDFESQFASQMNTAWTTGKNAAAASPGTLYEEGFIGTFDGTTITSQSTTLNTYPCGTTEDTTTTTVSLPKGANPVTGDSGGLFILGQFHTHPPVTYCTQSGYCFAPGPSSVDINTGNNSVFPLVVRTYSSQVCGDTNQNINAAYTDYPYGPTCTEYFPQ